jgi:hypothetical protein
VAADGKETYEETWEKISVNRLLKLSEIKDFDSLDYDRFFLEKIKEIKSFNFLITLTSLPPQYTPWN